MTKSGLQRMAGEERLKRVGAVDECRRWLEKAGVKGPVAERIVACVGNAGLAGVCEGMILSDVAAGRFDAGVSADIIGPR